MQGIDVVFAARIAWRRIAITTDGPFEALDDTTKAALMELGLEDPAIREAATVTVEIA
ncbi:MAG: hypothetical protein INR66_03045 [Gordonia polyisoprenivorans]|nr:hypothetical protein [Gordonia polyisoprenivorans]